MVARRRGERQAAFDAGYKAVSQREAHDALDVAELLTADTVRELVKARRREDASPRCGMAFPVGRCGMPRDHSLPHAVYPYGYRYCAVCARALTDSEVYAHECAQCGERWDDYVSLGKSDA